MPVSWSASEKRASRSFRVIRSKPLKSENIAPAARDLAVGHPEGAVRDRVDQRRDGLAGEDAVAKIAENDGVGGRLGDLLGELPRIRSEIERLSSVSTFSRS